MSKAAELRRKGLTRLGDVLEAYMSTGFMDIRRLSDVSGLVEELYSNVPVHFSPIKIDAPNPAATSVKPVVVDVTLHMGLNIDLRNGDTVVLKLPDADGAVIIDSFSGVAGDPYTTSSRKRVRLTMKQLGRGDIRDSVTSLPQPKCKENPRDTARI